MPERTAHAHSLAEALERCARHGRGGLEEMLGALRAGVDAVSFLLFRCAADKSPLDPFWLLIDELAASIADANPDSASLLHALEGALDKEIARWEGWGRDDPEALAVARAFAELRALLREFSAPHAEPRHAAPRRQKTQKPRRSARRSV